MKRWQDAKHKQPVRTGLRAAHDSGPRDTSRIRLVVIHDTEGGTADSVNRYFHSPASAASTHWVVDEKEAVRNLPDNRIPWGAPGANTDGIHIEQCGYARWSIRDWYRHQSTLKRAAWVAAEACKRYGIPASWLTDRQLADGRTKGLTFHAQVSRVFHGSDHTDPGPNFPRRYFIRLVSRRRKWLA